MTTPIAEKIGYKGGFPVYCSRYVIFSGTDCRVALRFYNASGLELTGVRFLLNEFDSAGSELMSREIRRDGLSAESDTEFSVADTTVNADCVRVEVKVLAVYSGDYAYTVDGDAVRLSYGNPQEKASPLFLGRFSASVSKRRKFTFIAAVCAVLAFAVVAGVLAWQRGIFDKITTASAEIRIERELC